MQTQSVEYKDVDVTLRGFLALDERQSTRRPGILVMPEAFGLGAHAKQRAERLAALGYVALAGDPYGNGIELNDLQEAIQLASALASDPLRLRRRARVALDKLASLPQVDPRRLAAIGFCMGGTFGLELAREGAALSGVVTFHSVLQTQRPAAPGQIKAKILVHTGADDPLVPFSAVSAFAEEMTKAGADWQVISYGGAKHSFTNPQSDALQNPALGYSQRTDERSWKSMISFFGEIFA